MNDKVPSSLSIIVQLRVLQSNPCFPQVPVKDGKIIRNGIAQQKAIIKRDLPRVKIRLLASGKLNKIHLELGKKSTDTVFCFGYVPNFFYLFSVTATMLKSVVAVVP